jgi:hypothetical protein
MYIIYIHINSWWMDPGTPHDSPFFLCMSIFHNLSRISYHYQVPWGFYRWSRALAALGRRSCGARGVWPCSWLKKLPGRNFWAPWCWSDPGESPKKGVENGYGSIPIDTFLVGWTSIYQLFWGSLGTRILTHPQMMKNDELPGSLMENTL